MGTASLRTPMRTSLADDILCQLLEAIEARSFPAGELLPSERRLSEIFGVGRPTVREAIRALRILGILDTRHGAGSRLVANAADIARKQLQVANSGVLPMVVRLAYGVSDVLEEASLPNLLEVREALECQATELAAKAVAAGHDIAPLREALEAMQAATGDLETFFNADYVFHSEVCRAAGNRELEAMTQIVRGLWGVLWKQHELEIGRIVPERTYQNHVRIFRAVAAGRPRQARTALIAHFGTLKEWLANYRVSTRKGGDNAT